MNSDNHNILKFLNLQISSWSKPSKHNKKHFNISKLVDQQLEHAQQTHQEALQTQDFLMCHCLVMDKVGGMSLKCIQQREAAFLKCQMCPENLFVGVLWVAQLSKLFICNCL